MDQYPIPIPPMIGDPLADDSTIEKWVDEHLEGVNPSERPPFTIETVSQANWSMARWRQANDALAEIRQVAQEAHDRIEKWERHESRRLLATSWFFAAHLVDYALRVRHETRGQTRSVRLIDGRVKTTARGEHVGLVDDAKVIAWAKQNDVAGVFVRTKEEVRMMALQRLAITDRLAGWIVHLMDGTVTTVLVGERERPEVGEMIGDVPVDLVEDYFERVVVDPETGEIVPGVEVVPEEIRGSVEANR